MPRLHDNGCFFTVCVSEWEVREWARTWPCFGPRRAIWFQFDKRNGDLVDMKSGADRDCDPSGILALSRDAQLWGELKRGTLFSKPLRFGADIAQRYVAECKK